LIRGLDGRAGRVRDRLLNAIKGKPQQAEQVEIALTNALAAAVVEQAEGAARGVSEAWRATTYGVAPERGDELARASADLRHRAAVEVRAWQDDLQLLVRRNSGDLTATSRFLAFGVRGLAAAVAVVTLTRDGAPEGVADSARLGRRLLDNVFGPVETVSMLDESRDQLNRRLRGLCQGEVARYGRVMSQWGVREDAAEQLRHAVRRVDDLRFAALTDSTGGTR
jgi:hypothetical protein